MANLPEHPKIYHITHVENLAAIVAEGALLSDRAILERGGAVQTIGMSSIKKRRVERLRVPCHPGTKVGDFVPFNFCPRSIMLSVIYYRNHPELDYQGGQTPIVHLEADLHTVLDWADAKGVRWAIALTNAGALYTEFRADRDSLQALDWASIAARNFNQPDVKEAKQAEFLLHGRFPFELVERIGVRCGETRKRAMAALEGLAQSPPVAIRSKWYF